MAGSDIAAIEAVIGTYLDGLHEGDTEKLGRAFHPCAHLYSVQEGQVVDVPRESWLEVVRNRPSPRAQDLPRHDRILTIDMSGPDNALVKLQCAIPPRYFTDYLMLLRTAEGWRIVSKSYRTESRAP